MNNSNFIDSLIVHFINHNGSITDQGGFILTRKEKDTLILKINQFYAEYDDIAIEEFNQKKKVKQ